MQATPLTTNLTGPELLAALEVMPPEKRLAIEQWLLTGAQNFYVIVEKGHRSYVDCVHLSKEAALADLASAPPPFREKTVVAEREFEEGPT